jgi:hypothetical protein
MLAMTVTPSLRWMAIDRTPEPALPASRVNPSPLVSDPVLTAIPISLGFNLMSGTRAPPTEPTKDTSGPTMQAVPPDWELNTAAV